MWLLILLCIICILFIYRHFVWFISPPNQTLIQYTSTDCSYGLWFRINDWKDNTQKSLIRQTVNETQEVDFEVFLGNYTNELFIYLPQNQSYVQYNHCEPKTPPVEICPDGYELIGTDCKPKTTNDTEEKCRQLCNDSTTCTGFSYNNTCMNYYTIQLPDCSKNANYITEYKYIKVASIPLKQWVKLVIIFRGKSMDVYINNKLIHTYFFWKPTKSAIKTIAITPEGTGFEGNTAKFTYWNKCLSLNEIKVY